MRGRIVLLVAATSSAVILAFVIPLALLLRTVALDRAVSAATQEAQGLAVLAGAESDPAEVERLVLLEDERSPRIITLALPDGTAFGATAGTDPDLARAAAGRAFTRVDEAGAAVYAPVVTPAGTAVVRSLVLPEDLRRGVARATGTIVGLALLLLVAAVVAADRLALWLVRPVRDLATAADALRSGHLDTRVPERGPPEIVASAAALNRLASRIGELLTAERDVVADLSHRLRTPITALRLDTESLALRVPAEAESVERLHQHVAALERTVDAIVHDARRPVRTSVGASCDAVSVVADRVAFWSVLAEDQGRALETTLPDQVLHVALEADDLADVVDVLLDNVFAHTPDGTCFAVTVMDTGPGVALVVSDGGNGMAEGDLVVRGVSGAGSSGLGLDIARRAAVASGGGLSLDRTAGGGARVVVRLGRARP